MGSTCVEATLRALSDEKSLTLFNMVVFTLSQDTGAIMTKLGITKRQYYLRMNQLIDASLVMRKNGKYLLTSLGKVVYQSHMLIVHAIENYWKLKAIDSIEASLPNGLSVEKRRRIIDALIERNDIKNVLLDHNIPSDVRDKVSGPQKVSVLSETQHIKQLASTTKRVGVSVD